LIRACVVGAAAGAIRIAAVITIARMAPSVDAGAHQILTGA
jgi:hypothetical protein